MAEPGPKAEELFTPYDAPPPPRREFTPSDGIPRQLLAGVVAVAVLLVAGVSFVVQPWHHASKTKTASAPYSSLVPLSTTGTGSATTATGLRPPAGPRPLTKIVLTGLDVNSFATPSTYQWQPAGAAGTDTGVALPPDPCNPTAPAPASFTGARFTWDRDNLEGLHGSVNDVVLRFPTAAIAKAYIDSYRAPGYRQCNDIALLAYVTTEVPITRLGRATHADISPYAGGLAYRTTLSLVMVDHACTVSDDHLWNQVGTDVIDTDIVSCQNPFPDDTQLQQLQANRISGQS